MIWIKPVARTVFASVLLCMGLSHASAVQPTLDALSRPALVVRQPEHGVLLSAVLAGDRVVAVGERGLVLVSDDGGTQWRQVMAPVSVTLTAARFADAAHGVAVGHGGSILTTGDGGLTWTLRLDGRRVAQIALKQAEANGDVAKLKDAQRLVDDGPDKPFLDVAILGEGRMLAVGAYGMAYFSPDGGVTWQPWADRLPNPRGLHLYVIRQHGNTVMVAGEQGLLFRSDDGGASFKSLDSPYRGSWFAGALLDSNQWVIAGLRGNGWLSIDGGVTWKQLLTPIPASITAVERTHDGALLFASQSGHVLKMAGDRLVPITQKSFGPLTGLLEVASGRLLMLGFNGIVTAQTSR